MSGKRYLFYDTTDGEIFHHYARRRNPQPVERVIEIYPEISQRSQESYGVIVLDYEQYTQDFTECNGYKVNTSTKTLEFSYPDPNEPKELQPYRAPLSVEVDELKQKIELQDATMEELMFVIIPDLTGGGI